MEIKRFEFNLFGENTYLIWDGATREAAVADPGMMSPDEYDEIANFISSNGLAPKFILLTHAHVDHTLGVDFLKKKYGIPVIGHKDDAPLGQMRPQQAKMFHLPVDPEPLEPDRFISDGSKLKLGEEIIKVIATPGHSLGGVCYYIPESGFILTGDTLFQGSIGRTDLPGGNQRQLIKSIKNKLMKLPADTVVYPGHGPATTIGREAVSNPFL